MTAALTQLKKAVASTQRVNRRHFTESIVKRSCFKMYAIKMKKEKKTNENP